MQAAFAEHLEQQLGWESVYAWNQETFGPQGVTQFRLAIEDGVWRQTASVHEVRTADIARPEATAENRSQIAILVDEGPVPQEQIQLMRSFVSPGHAD